MQLHKTHNPLTEQTRTASCNLLTVTLATTTDLLAQLKQAHWNVKGNTFYPLHLLFDEVAKELFESVDEVAERIMALGGTAYGTIQDAAKGTILKPYPNNIFTPDEHCQALTDRLGVYCKHLADNITKTEDLGDMGTSDLYIELVRLYEKRMWFIEAHLQ